MVDYKDEIIQAINKDIQKEKWLSFWKKYYTVIIIGVVLIVGAISSFSWWSYSNSVARYDASRSLLAYLHDLDSAESSASESLVSIEELLRSSKTLWPIQSLNYVSELARKYSDKNKPSQAIEVLNSYQPINDEFFDKFVELQKGEAYLLSKDYDRAFEIFESLSNSSTVWRYFALEWLAELSFQSKDFAASQSYLKTISDDPNAPQALRERSSRILILID